MKNSKSFLSVIVSFLVLALGLSGCLKEHDDLVPMLEGVPAGGMTSLRVTNIEDDIAEVEMTFFVVDHFGGFIPKLKASDFSFSKLQAVTEASISALEEEKDQEKGPFSAMLLFDQSGSIRGTDPNDARIDAGTSFAEIVKGGDEAAVAAFASGGFFQSPYELLAGFTSESNQLVAAIEGLAGKASGGTPLYRSIYDLTPYTSSNSKNPNRAIVAFTDGQDTDGGISISQLVQQARECIHDVRIYTVGLSQGVDFGALSDIALQTGGAVMLAEDAIQLVSLYNSLGDLLHGRAELYRMTMRFKHANSSWQAGSRIAGTLSLQLSGTLTVDFPFQITLTQQDVGKWYERLPDCKCSENQSADIISKWKDKANEYLNRNKDDEIINLPITCAYADIYMKNPEKFKWAGLAAIVSGIIGEEYKSIWDVPGISDPSGFLENLLNGNKAVFDDLFWQHLAFLEGGINEIEKIYCAGGITLEVYRAWLKIAQNDDDDDVWQGNQDLLYHEQKNILQSILYDPHGTIWDLLDIGGQLKSPVPGHVDEFPDGKSFDDFNERWDWTESSILPAWREYETNTGNKAELIGELKRYCPSCCQ